MAGWRMLPLGQCRGRRRGIANAADDLEYQPFLGFPPISRTPQTPLARRLQPFRPLRPVYTLVKRWSSEYLPRVNTLAAGAIRGGRHRPISVAWPDYWGRSGRWPVVSMSVMDPPSMCSRGMAAPGTAPGIPAAVAPASSTGQMQGCRSRPGTGRSRDRRCGRTLPRRAADAPPECPPPGRGRFPWWTK